MGCTESSESPVAEGPTDSGAAPVSLQYREITTIIDTKISGLFSKDMAATPQENGALFQHVTKAANEGLALVAAYTKMAMPPPSVGEPENGSSWNGGATLATWFVAVPSGTALSTVVVYAPLNVDASIGFLNSKIHSLTGVTGAVHSYAAQGYELAAMGIAGGSETTKFMSGDGLEGDTSSSSLAELVFQRPEPCKPSAISITQSAIKVSWKTGEMKSIVPDLVPFLNEMGAEGFYLSGFLMPPMPLRKALIGTGTSTSALPSYLTPDMDMPVQTIMRKEQDTTKKYKYCNATFYYKIKMGFKPTIEGDPSALIQSYASKGWTLTGVLHTPRERDGMMGIKMPSELFFVAEHIKTNAL